MLAESPNYLCVCAIWPAAAGSKEVSWAHGEPWPSLSSSLPLTEPLMSTPDILTRIKQEQPYVGGGQYPDERGIPADPCAGDGRGVSKEGGCFGA